MTPGEALPWFVVNNRAMKTGEGMPSYGWAWEIELEV